MKKLKSLLEKVEPKDFQSLLKKYDSLNGKAVKKRRLLNYITSNQNHTENEIQKIFYGDSPNAHQNFRRLKNRLKKDIIEHSSKNTINMGFHAQLILNNRNSIQSGEFLINKAATQTKGQQILSKSERDAQENSLYLNEVLINRIKIKNLYYNESPLKGFECNQKAHILAMKLDEAKTFHYTVKYLYLNQHQDLYLIEQLTRLMESVRVNYQKYNSTRIGFHYHLGSKLLHDIVRDHGTSQYHVDQLLYLVQNNPQLQYPAFEAETLIHEAFTSLYGMDNKAIENFNLKEHFSPIKNDPVSLEYAVIILLQKRKMKPAQLLIEKVKQNHNFKENESITRRWEYFEAYYYFLNEEYQKAFKIVEQLCTYRSNMGTLKYYIPLLYYMTLVESKKERQLVLQLETFHKKLYRYAKKCETDCHRLHLILKGIQKLTTLQFKRRSKVSFDADLLIRKLQVNPSKREWNIINYEFVEFGEWLKGKRGLFGI